LIVSLLDLHFDVPGAKDTTQDRLEIFEAGTGHGALTLHLARAIHGANTAAPGIPSEQDRFETIDEKKVYQAWQKERRAVIQTLDCNISHSRHAQKVVRNFRHGIYYPHVEFHVGSIVEYLTSRLATSDQKPFLDHVILDLPNTQEYFEIVKKVLKPNGTLITFCPSITQINASVTLVKQKSMPLFLEKVIEVGAGIGVGGREWDVRPVKPRALMKSEAGAFAQAQAAEKIIRDAEGESQDSERDRDEKPAGELDELPNPQPADIEETGLEMVCRPKVGGRIAGGGFLGVWRKMINFAGEQR
jgi:tRNA (adenine57-N1/adenine58-N1)-methyltransferase